MATLIVHTIEIIGAGIAERDPLQWPALLWGVGPLKRDLVELKARLGVDL
jgi:hypothetical protein